MGAVTRGVEADFAHPPIHDPRVLSGGQVRRVVYTALEEKVLRMQARMPDPRGYGLPGGFGDLELYGSLGLLLHDDRSRGDVIAVGDVAHAQLHQVAGTQ